MGNQLIIFTATSCGFAIGKSISWKNLRRVSQSVRVEAELSCRMWRRTATVPSLQRNAVPINAATMHSKWVQAVLGGRTTPWKQQVPKDQRWRMFARKTAIDCNNIARYYPDSGRLRPFSPRGEKLTSDIIIRVSGQPNQDCWLERFYFARGIFPGDINSLVRAGRSSVFPH